MSTPTEQTQHYVILGAGAAGTLLALELSKISYPIFRVTLIDNKEFHEFTPSIVNVLLQPTTGQMRSRLNTVCPKLSEMFKGTKVNLVKGVVESITAEEVILKDARIPFSELIICTGSSYSAPYKLSLKIETVEQRFEDLLQAREKIEAADSILCVGGGPVGVEMAGELAVRYPAKSLTLVHSKPELLDKIPGKLGPDASACLEEKTLRKAAVKVILNEKALPNNDEAGTYTTSETHQVLTPGHVIQSRGIAPNSEFMVVNFSECLDEQKYIQVDAFFRVAGQTNIFAIGDVTNLPDPKLYFTAHMQALHLCSNLNAALNDVRLTPYKGSKCSYAVSIGPEVGLLSLSDGLFTIRGFRQFFFRREQKGSRLAIVAKQFVERVSLTGVPASVMNQFLYYTSTK